VRCEFLKNDELLGSLSMRREMQTLPRVSIVTISFNQIRYLERTIRSVLDQDHPDTEYIIVDPGSTDGSLELIRRYESRIARAIFEPDYGPADGLNKGFASATGEIFGFLNSDDILYPGAISGAVRYLLKHPKVDVVSGHAKVVGPDERVYRHTYSDRWNARKYIYSGAVLIQASTFFRRSAFEKAGKFNIENRATWDGELFFDMARVGCRFGRSDEIWCGYRLHPESITATKRLEEVRTALHRRQFQELIGREPNRWDKPLYLMYRFWKHLANPRDTFERVFRGPVFGRKLD
jgi:glycosyltransferase involved in cell wall biosynthesis